MVVLHGVSFKYFVSIHVKHIRVCHFSGEITDLKSNCFIMCLGMALTGLKNTFMTICDHNVWT